MKWLKFFREKSGLSLNKLADLIGVQMNSVWRWESGRATPSAEIVRNLANALCVSETELLNGPVSENWEIRIKLAKEGVIEVGNMGTSFDLNVGNTAMAVTVSGSYDIWEDEAKFESQIIAELRAKRSAGLKLHKEAF